MKISKDEARFLAEMVRVAKWGSWSHARTKEEANEWAKAIQKLEDKLQSEGDDQRRHGRTSQNDWRELMLRLVNKYQTKNENRI